MTAARLPSSAEANNQSEESQATMNLQALPVRLEKQPCSGVNG